MTELICSLKKLSTNMSFFFLEWSWHLHTTPRLNSENYRAESRKCFYIWEYDQTVYTEERKEIVQESSFSLLSQIPRGALLPSSGIEELGCLKRPLVLSDFFYMWWNPFLRTVFALTPIPCKNELHLISLGYYTLSFYLPSFLAEISGCKSKL